MDVKNQENKNFKEINYLKFENYFRGSEGLLKNQQSRYIEYFRKCKNILDLGCGRGEFLELCKESQIKCTGIEIDKNMFEHCKKKGLNVINVNIFDYLMENSDIIIDGIFIAQVIEHMDFIDIQKLFYFLQQKLKNNAVVIIETPNPLCVPALNRFYLDLTHKKPIFPDTLAFIANEYEFEINKILFSYPLDPNLESFTESDKKIDQYQNYAVIFKKK